MKLSRAWAGLLIAALSCVAAVAVGAEAKDRIRQTLEDKPSLMALSKRLVRVSLEKKAQPLRVTPPRRISASLENKKVAYVGSGTVRRRIRRTLDDAGYLGDAHKAKPKVPTLAFATVTTTPAPQRKRVFRLHLGEGPVAAARPRPLRTSLD